MINRYNIEIEKKIIIIVISFFYDILEDFVQVADLSL